MTAHITPLHDAEAPFAPEGPHPILRPIPPGQPYPVADLGPLRAAVEAVQDMTQAPVAIAAQSALAVASLAVQGFADVDTLGGPAPCSLFCLTIAESGERKSSCDRLLMQGIRDHEAGAAVTHRADLAYWLTSCELWEARRKRLVAEAAGKDRVKAIAAEADLRALGPKPEPPLHPNLTAMEPTFEGLLKLYSTGRPSLGLFSDEAGGFIGGHAMNSDNRLKTMAGLSRLWNGEAIDRTRSGDGVSSYRGRRLAAHLMVQPVAARPLLADPLALGQGFLPRFLICEPPSAIGTRLRRGHDPASEAALAAFRDRLATILDRPLPTPDHRQELAPRRLPLDPAARELLARFGEAVERAQAPGGEMEQARAFASKAAEQAARIAGVLTLWADLDALAVTPEAMGWGCELAQFYLNEARRLIDAGAVSTETAKAEALRKWLVETWPHDDVTSREIVRYGPNALRERARLTAPLSVLVSAGWLVPLPEGTFIRGAARKDAWRIVRGADAV